MNNEKKEELKAIGVSQEDINKLNVDKEKRNNTVANILKKISFWEGFIGFICFCIILIVFENEGIILAFTEVIVCAISSIFMYSLGEIIDLIQENVNNTKTIIKMLENER